jgi:hypothetical protein
MTKTVVALYQDLDMAENVVRDLVDAGFARDTISLVANDAQGIYADRYVNNADATADYDDEDVKPGEGAGFGAVVGALVGLGVALIPGIGPVLAVGPLAAALMAGIGAAAGAVTGGVVASLVDFGIPEEEAHVYAESLRRGATLVSVATDDASSARAEDILNRHHPLDVEDRGEFYRDAGWNEFDHEGQPYATSDIDNDRAAYRNFNASVTPASAPPVIVDNANGSLPTNSDYLANVDSQSQAQSQGSAFPTGDTMRNSDIGDSVYSGAASNPGISGAGTGAGDLLSNPPSAPIDSQDWDHDTRDEEGMTPEERERAWVDRPSGSSRSYTRP